MDESQSEDGMPFEVAVDKLSDMFPGIGKDAIIVELQKSGRKIVINRL